MSFFWIGEPIVISTDTITELLLPLRPLLSTKNEFLWPEEHDQALANAKKHLVSVPTLAFFDVQKPTRLCTDASRLGFVLQQLSATGQWVLIQAGSRFLTPTETWYAVIKLELLAVA